MSGVKQQARLVEESVFVVSRLSCHGERALRGSQCTIGKTYGCASTPTDGMLELQPQTQSQRMPSKNLFLWSCILRIIALCCFE